MAKDLIGLTVRDLVTGFTGMVTTQSRHISGCDTVWITPPLTTDEKGEQTPGKEQHFDVTRIEVVPDGATYRPTVPPVVGG